MHQPSEVIRSSSNPALKRVRGVLAGREKGTLVLEGRRLIGDALAAGLTCDLVLLRAEEERHELWEPGAAPECEVRYVAADLLSKVSALETSPGSLALVRAPQTQELDAWDLPVSDALVLVVAGISDPGNLGGLARSAEAAGACGIVVVAGGVSPWSSKAQRGSMGSLLRLPVLFAADSAAAFEGLAKKGMRQCIAATRDGALPAMFDWSGPVALWVSGETGAAPSVPLERLTLPMSGEVESLNVTVAGSLLLFAAGRASTGTRTERGGESS